MELSPKAEAEQSGLCEDEEPCREARKFGAKRRICPGEFISPGYRKNKGAPARNHPGWGGSKDVLMLDNAPAMVDNVVSMKLGL